MLKMGAQNITGLYVGETKIKKAYLGEALIFSAGENPSRLPEGYTEVQYIVVPKDAYVNIPSTRLSKSCRIVRKIKLLSFDETAKAIQSFYGFGSSIFYFYIARVYGDENSIYYRVANYSKSGNVQIDSSKEIIIDANFPDKKLIIGENTIDVPESSNVSYFSVFNTSKSTSEEAPQNFYSLQFYKSDELTLDLVPCINPENTAGLYDLVSDAFYNNTSKIGTPFVAGPAV